MHLRGRHLCLLQGLHCLHGHAWAPLMRVLDLLTEKVGPAGTMGKTLQFGPPDGKEDSWGGWLSHEWRVSGSKGGGCKAGDLCFREVWQQGGRYRESGGLEQGRDSTMHFSEAEHTGAGPGDTRWH